MKEYIKLLSIGVMLLVTILRPWHSVNESLGVTTLADIYSRQVFEKDSIILTQGIGPVSSPVTVVLPTAQVDSLAKQIKQREEKKLVLTEKAVKLDKQIGKLKTTVEQKADVIISLKEIEDMVVKQNKGKGDETQVSDLEIEVNGPDKPKKP